MTFKPRQMGAAGVVTTEMMEKTLLEYLSKPQHIQIAERREMSISFIGKWPRKKKKKMRRDFRSGKLKLI